MKKKESIKNADMACKTAIFVVIFAIGMADYI